MKLLPALLGMVLLTSCGRSSDVPKDVLPPEKMESVMWDMIRADEMINYRKVRDTNYTNEHGKRLLDTVFNLHNITETGFKKSLQYYQEHPRLLKNILDSLQVKADASQIEISSAQ